MKEKGDSQVAYREAYLITNIKNPLTHTCTWQKHTKDDLEEVCWLIAAKQEHANNDESNLHRGACQNESQK